MSGAETARRRVVQRRIGGAESAAPKWPSPLILISSLKFLMNLANNLPDSNYDLILFAACTAKLIIFSS